MTSTVKIEELRALAEKATRGEWRYRPRDYDDWGWVVGPDGYMVALGRAGHSMCVEAEGRARVEKKDPYGHNAKFIAAANPETVLALLTERDAHIAEIERLKLELKDEKAGRAYDKLHDQAELESLRSLGGTHGK